MLGYIEYDGGRSALRIVKEKRCGGTFLVAYTGCRAAGLFERKRADRAAGMLREQGIRRAVFPVDFPFGDVFSHRGILPVDPQPLRIRLCPQIIRKRLAAALIDEREAVVAVAGDHVSAALEQTVRALVRDFRHVLLSVSGGENLARELWQQQGAAVQLNPSRDRLESADALVLLAPRGELSGGNQVICSLYPGAAGRGKIDLSLPAALENCVAANCSREQLAAALYSMGVLPIRKFLGEITC